MKKNLFLIVFNFIFFNCLYSQSNSLKPQTIASWTEKVQIRGYLQTRYNRLFETNQKLRCEQCDRSWGENQSVFIRRARIIFFGQVSEQVYFYIQPDLASAPSTATQNFAQIRDAYVDVGFDKKNEFRIRIGQSKIPYGFENMQSSQNRIALDRTDALNSAVSNERDLGAFFYWAPRKKRELFRDLVANGLKGSGDYGVFAFGVYNGQTANRPELNNSMHKVAKFTWPFTINKQIIEASIQGYTGKYVVPKEQTSSLTKIHSNREFLDERVAATFILYPKPFGVNLEYNIGSGPVYNKLKDSIETQRLNGGYIQFSYYLKIKQQTIIPFYRFHYYNGGKKHELDARSYNVNESELGVEWQLSKAFEFVAMFTISKRRFEDNINENNYQKGSLLRLQAQLNF